MFALYTPGRYDDDPESVALLHKYSFWGLHEVFECECVCVRVLCDVIVDSKNKNKAEIELYFH